MHLIIIGAGKTGRHVIQSAVADHHEVYVIEKDKEAANWVATHYDCVVINADAANIESLKEAKADKADSIIVTTNNDAINMLVILMAKQFGIKRLVSSVNDESHFPIFEQMGIDTVESPYRLNGRYLYRAIQGPSVKDFLDLGDGIEIIEFLVSSTSKANNRQLKDLSKENLIPKESKIIIVKRQNQIIVPEGDTVIKSGDIIAAISNKKSLTALIELFSEKNNSK